MNVNVNVNVQIDVIYPKRRLSANLFLDCASLCLLQAPYDRELTSKYYVYRVCLSD